MFQGFILPCEKNTGDSGVASTRFVKAVDPDDGQLIFNATVGKRD